jgi:signal transduction histidine kinase
MAAKRLSTFFSLIFLLASPVMAEVTHQEVIGLVKESSAYLTKEGKRALKKMNRDISKQWRKGNSYIFVVDCKSGATLVHAKKAVLGMDLVSKLKDKKTGRYFLKDMCNKTNNEPKGVWHTYWWAKPKESKPSRKVSFIMRNEKYHNYMLGSGIYSETLDMSALKTK